MKVASSAGHNDFLHRSRRDASGARTAVKLTRQCLAMAAAVAGCAMLVAPSAANADWGLVEEEFAGGPACLVMGGNAKTILMIKADAGDVEDDHFAIIVSNPKWSIEKGEDIGEIGMYSHSGAVFITPHTGNGGFFYYVPSSDMDLFVEDLESEGITLKRGEQVIAEFSQENLLAEYQKLKRCTASRFGPFGG